MQGLGFIVQIAWMIFHNVQKKMKEKNLSVKDTMFMLKGLKLIKEHNQYVIRNENKERKKLGDKLELNVTKHGISSSPA